MERVLIVSVDSHAQAPPEAWPEYLEQRYHEYLPALHEDNEVYTTVMGPLSYPITGSPEALAVYDPDGAQAGGGYRGIWDADVRLREMDREGIAGEFVYFGDHRASAMFYNVFNRGIRPRRVRGRGPRLPPVVCRHLRPAPGPPVPRRRRWPGHDIERHVGRARRGSPTTASAGTYAPGFLSYARRAAAVRRVLGAGLDAVRGPRASPVRARGLRPASRDASSRGSPRSRTRWTPPAGTRRRPWSRRSRARCLTGDFFSDVSPAAPDVAADARRRLRPSPGPEAGDDRGAGRLAAGHAAPSRRGLRAPPRRPPRTSHARPSTGTANCLVSLSFPHRAEVAMRHEIGLETVAFGRDYPHNESTWPNTMAWLRDAFDGVPENELRLILGENVIRALGPRSQTRLAASPLASARPSSSSPRGPAVDPALVASLRPPGRLPKALGRRVQDPLDLPRRGGGRRTGPPLKRGRTAFQ